MCDIFVWIFLDRPTIQEEAAQKVRARPAPTPSMGFVPAPCARPLTDTREFAFSSQARHERAQQQFRDRVRREEERARRATKVRWASGSIVDNDC